MVQRWDENVPLDETLTALELAVSTGRVRYIGVSNFSGWQTARAFTLLERSIPLSVTQNEYSLLNRDAENEILPCAKEVGLGVLAWSPLGRGVLTGKYLNGVPADFPRSEPTSWTLRLPLSRTSCTANCAGGVNGCRWTWVCTSGNRLGLGARCARNFVRHCRRSQCRTIARNSPSR